MRRLHGVGGAGAQAEVSERIRTLGANLLLVMPGALSSGGARLESGTQPTLTEEDAAAIRRELADVQVAAPLLSHSMPLVAGNRNWMSLVAGINPDYLVAREWQVTDGRSFTGGEIGSGAKVAVVGSVIIEELFGGRSGIGEAFRIGSVPFTVIGVLGKKGLGAAGCSQDDVVFIPLSTAKSRVLGAVRGTTRDALDFISIKVSDAGAMPEVEGKIESLLGLLLIAVASVSLVVGGISIMNIMLVSVTERTREIGLRVAVGARRRDIRWQFLIEALTLALVGGLVGAFLGAAAAIAIALKAGWPVLISPWTIILACGFAGFVGISFGLYPAHRAARIDPIVALRFE